MTKELIKPGVWLNIQPTKQFSTVRIEFNFVTPMDAQLVAARTLLAKMLESASQKYPSQTDLAQALSRMYGAGFGVDVLKIGRLHVIKAHLEIIDDHFVSENSSLLQQGLAFMREMLFNPLGDAAQGFDLTVFTRQKELLLDEMAGLEDDRPYIANRYALNAYFDETRQALPAYGTTEVIEAVTPKEAFAAWQDMLATNRLDIVVSGDVKEADIIEALANLPVKATKPNVDAYYHQEAHKMIVQEQETQHVNQTQLVLVYQLAVSTEARFSAYVFEQIFGGTPVSRLFLDVRETRGLAYSIATDYNRFSDVLLVSAGIDGHEVVQTRQAILDNLVRLQQELITPVELETIKSLMKTEFMVSLDNQSQLTDRAFIESFTGQSVEKWFEALDAVTVESVQAIAQKMILQVEYLLKGDRTDEID